MDDILHLLVGLATFPLYWIIISFPVFMILAGVAIGSALFIFGRAWARGRIGVVGFLIRMGLSLISTMGLGLPAVVLSHFLLVGILRILCNEPFKNDVNVMPREIFIVDLSQSYNDIIGDFCLVYCKELNYIYDGPIQYYRNYFPPKEFPKNTFYIYGPSNSTSCHAYDVKQDEFELIGESEFDNLCLLKLKVGNKNVPRYGVIIVDVKGEPSVYEIEYRFAIIIDRANRKIVNYFRDVNITAYDAYGNWITTVSCREVKTPNGKMIGNVGDAIKYMIRPTEE